MTDPVVEVSSLSRRFGEKAALSSVSLDVAPGTVHGLVGANGAGKTTLIKHILGLYKAQQGSVRVFGMNPVEDPVKVLGRIGYLSEEHDIPRWMRVGEFIKYSRAFFPNWDEKFADDLMVKFSLDPGAKIADLSKGQKARSGLLAALAHRPALLLLDEPSSGLDPIVRRDIVNAVIRTAADEGQTVLFSSHLLDEVEQVADRITLIKLGQVKMHGSLEQIRAGHSCLQVRFSTPCTDPPKVPGVLHWQRRGNGFEALVREENEALTAAFEKMGGQVTARGPASLDQIFVAHVGAEDIAPEDP